MCTIASALEEYALHAPKAATIIPCCATLCAACCTKLEEREYRSETHEAEHVRAPLYIVRFVGTSRRGWAEREGRKERPERRNHSLKVHHSKINFNITPENHSGSRARFQAELPRCEQASSLKERRKGGKVQAYLTKARN